MREWWEITTGIPNHQRKGTTKKAQGVKSKNWIICGLNFKSAKRKCGDGRVILTSEKLKGTLSHSSKRMPKNSWINKISDITWMQPVMLITWRFFETFMRATGGCTTWCVNQQKLGLSDKHSPTYVRNMAGTKKSSTHMGSKRALEVRKAQWCCWKGNLVALAVSSRCCSIRMEKIQSRHVFWKESHLPLAALQTNYAGTTQKLPRNYPETTQELPRNVQTSSLSIMTL